MSNASVSDIGVSLKVPSQNPGILTVNTSLDFAAWRIAAQAWEAFPGDLLTSRASGTLQV
jgi:hypothetical protein